MSGREEHLTQTHTQTPRGTSLRQLLNTPVKASPIRQLDFFMETSIPDAVLLGRGSSDAYAAAMEATVGAQERQRQSPGGARTLTSTTAVNEQSEHSVVEVETPSLSCGSAPSQRSMATPQRDAAVDGSPHRPFPPALSLSPKGLASHSAREDRHRRLPPHEERGNTESSVEEPKERCGDGTSENSVAHDAPSVSRPSRQSLPAPWDPSSGVGRHVSATRHGSVAADTAGPVPRLSSRTGSRASNVVGGTPSQSQRSTSASQTLHPSQEERGLAATPLYWSPVYPADSHSADATVLVPASFVEETCDPFSSHYGNGGFGQRQHAGLSGLEDTTGKTGQETPECSVASAEEEEEDGKPGGDAREETVDEGVDRRSHLQPVLTQDTMTVATARTTTATVDDGDVPTDGVACEEEKMGRKRPRLGQLGSCSDAAGGGACDVSDRSSSGDSVTVCGGETAPPRKVRVEEAKSDGSGAVATNTDAVSVNRTVAESAERKQPSPGAMSSFRTTKWSNSALRVYVLHDVPGRRDLVARCRRAMAALPAMLNADGTVAWSEVHADSADVGSRKRRRHGTTGEESSTSTTTTVTAASAHHTAALRRVEGKQPAPPPPSHPCEEAIQPGADSLMETDTAQLPVRFVDTCEGADVVVTHELSARESVLAAVAAGKWVVTPVFLHRLAELVEQQTNHVPRPGGAGMNAASEDAHVTNGVGHWASIPHLLEVLEWSPERVPASTSVSPPSSAVELARQCRRRRCEWQTQGHRVFDRMAFVLWFPSAEWAGATAAVAALRDPPMQANHSNPARSTVDEAAKSSLTPSRPVRVAVPSAFSPFMVERSYSRAAVEGTSSPVPVAQHVQQGSPSVLSNGRPSPAPLVPSEGNAARGSHVSSTSSSARGGVELEVRGENANVDVSRSLRKKIAAVERLIVAGGGRVCDVVEMTASHRCTHPSPAPLLHPPPVLHYMTSSRAQQLHILEPCRGDAEGSKALDATSPAAADWQTPLEEAALLSDLATILTTAVFTGGRARREGSPAQTPQPAEEAVHELVLLVDSALLDRYTVRVTTTPPPPPTPTTAAVQPEGTKSRSAKRGTEMHERRRGRKETAAASTEVVSLRVWLRRVFCSPSRTAHRSEPRSSPSSTSSAGASFSSSLSAGGLREVCCQARQLAQREWWQWKLRQPPREANGSARIGPHRTRTPSPPPLPPSAAPVVLNLQPIDLDISGDANVADRAALRSRVEGLQRALAMAQSASVSVAPSTGPVPIAKEAIAAASVPVSLPALGTVSAKCMSWLARAVAGGDRAEVDEGEENSSTVTSTALSLGSFSAL